MQDKYNVKTAGIGFVGTLMLAIALALFYLSSQDNNPAAVIFGIVLLLISVDCIWFEYTRYKAYKDLKKQSCSLER